MEGGAGPSVVGVLWARGLVGGCRQLPVVAVGAGLGAAPHLGAAFGWGAPGGTDTYMEGIHGGDEELSYLMCVSYQPCRNTMCFIFSEVRC